MKTIVTHNGPFHADDVLGSAIVSYYYDIYGVDYTFIRTHDQEQIASGNVVIDVGGVYDADNNRFDHHQVSFDLKRENNVPYSSAGLVWKTYGQRILQGRFDTYNSKFFTKILNEVDLNLIQGVDALDSGYGTLYLADSVPHATFSNAISSFNPTWQEGNSFDEEFKNAVDIAKVFLKREIKRAEGKAAAHDTALMAINLAYQQGHEKIIVFNSFLPAMEVLVDYSNAFFLIFPQEKDWLVQCIPVAGEAFSKRKELPEAWAGLREGDLTKVTGVKDAVFCHKGRFICGARSKEGAMALAQLALSA